MQVKIKQGFDLPMQGKPNQSIDQVRRSSRVAVLGRDFIGLRPHMKIKEGDRVRAAQPLFENKKNGLLHTSPASGKVISINRGPRRSLLSIEIEVDDDEALTFPFFDSGQLRELSSSDVKASLLASGLWTAFRVRPCGHNPGPEEEPHSIFVTAIDTNPLAIDPAVVIDAFPDEFGSGLTVLSRLFERSLYLCKSPSLSLPDYKLPGLEVVDFIGPHPAGLVGTHIHHLDAVHKENTVWHLGYQDVIAIGKLFVEGQLWTKRIIALSGPQMVKPRLLETDLGASLDELLQDELLPGNNRIISGSVLSGFAAVNEEAYLGRYHNQVTVLEKSGISGLAGGSRRFSFHSLLSLFGVNQYYSSTEILGNHRPMYPLGDFEELMPLGLLSTPLLRALLIGDVEEAVALGCLELEEEDLALCTYACVSKNDYGSALRRTLNNIAGI